MSKLYSIQETTLTDIGDALRSKYGETRPVNVEVPVTVIKNKNATALHNHGSWEYFTPNPQTFVFKCPGATHIWLAYSNTMELSDDGGYVKCAIGEYTVDTFPGDGIYLENTIDKVTKYMVLEADTITFLAYKPNSMRGFYIECSGWDDNNKSFITLEGSTTIERIARVPNTYSSADVAAAIEGLPSNVEPIVLTGNQTSGCNSQLAVAYINSFGDIITTENITTANYMFQKTPFEKIPFEINMGGSANQSMSSVFADCSNLKEVPKINNATPQHLDNFFARCRLLREIPEDFGDNWDLSYTQNNNSYSLASIFTGCYSLRKIPNSFLKQLWNKATGYYYKFYQNAFVECFVLDEVIDIMPDSENSTPMTSNMFSTTFRNTYRLKRLVWALQEDGSPMVVRWSGQTLDLTYYVGYSPARSLSFFTGYNSGITVDKEVIDDATYQALKNDPDWFTMGYEAYCRYNHDSAVETINSLPDTSAYLASSGGTNTIKFRGACGSATDGGAINTLTEEEIAVAAAKGWTVSFV